MENKVKDEKGTGTHEVAQVPVEAGTAIVDGVAVVGREVAKVVVEAATVIADATKVVVTDIAHAGEQLSRDAQQAVSPTSEPLGPSPPRAPITPTVVAPVVVTPIAVAPIAVQPLAIATEA